jgi:hypothetical protein
MSEVIAGLLSFVNDIPASYVKLSLNRHLPHAFQFNILLQSYDSTSLKASLNERVREFCTLELAMHRFEAVLRVMCYFDSVLAWLSSKSGQWQYVCCLLLCSAGREFSLLFAVTRLSCKKGQTDMVH